jgi:DNA polymerase-3 subunit alpha
VKFDFLGLKTLTVLKTAVGSSPSAASTIDLGAAARRQADLRDALAGETVGVFQVESAGMRKALIGMKPDRFEDIIAWWRSTARARWRTSRSTTPASTARRKPRLHAPI